jgi:hypothetical protein
VYALRPVLFRLSNQDAITLSRPLLLLDQPHNASSPGQRSEIAIKCPRKFLLLPGESLVDNPGIPGDQSTIVIKPKSMDLVLDQGEEKENESRQVKVELRTKFELGLGLGLEGDRRPGRGR